ncbi:MAG: FIST N-terminal domain-containing protein [Planctomycetota bacterium]|jgi:hypothetical protein
MATGILDDLRSAGSKISKALATPAAPALHNEPDIRDHLEGIREHLPDTIPLVGGNAENGKDAGVVFGGERSMPEVAIGIVFSGTIKVCMGSAINSDTVAGPLKITRMDGRKLGELSGRPVADVYTKVFKVECDAVDGGYVAQQTTAERMSEKYVIRYQRVLKSDRTFEGSPHAL